MWQVSVQSVVTQCPQISILVFHNHPTTLCQQWRIAETTVMHVLYTGKCYNKVMQGTTALIIYAL